MHSVSRISVTHQNGVQLGHMIVQNGTSAPPQAPPCHMSLLCHCSHMGTVISHRAMPLDVELFSPTL